MTIPQQPKKRGKTRSAHHKALFDDELPFGHKVEKDRTKYSRKEKYKNKDGNDL